MTTIIAVANEKGGVAKTTTVASLAGAFVELQREVLVVDLDAQANLTLAFGIGPAKVHRSVVNILLDSTSALSASRETGIPGLDLIPSSSEMGMAERFLPVRPNYQHILAHALKELDGYDFIILDCPPSLGAVTMNALAAAQLLVIPTQAEYFSAHALRSTFAAVRRVNAQYNPQLAYRLLITMFDQRNRIHRTLREQIETSFRERIFKTMIETDTKLRECPIVGLPITHYYAQSRSALQYRSLADEVVSYVQNSTASFAGTSPVRI